MIASKSELSDEFITNAEEHETQGSQHTSTQS